VKHGVSILNFERKKVLEDKNCPVSSAQSTFAIILISFKKEGK